MGYYSILKKKDGLPFVTTWMNLEDIILSEICQYYKSKFCSVAQSCPTLRDPMDCSMPGLPVLHHLPEFAQVHVYCIGDAI